MRKGICYLYKEAYSLKFFILSDEEVWSAGCLLIQ